ncbi:3-hydroxyacyl-ACP dehydratase [Vibrio hannami]|uniref:ApeI family dehydratase n=1 Tax=Vibrio hannami TaxID=2717094 RepID=UPI00241053FA|nr:3-hydroxyacyl-ACP dehydratase [Vibrio hannami]MDG3087533.1 3-hydroxyacyl-ACP dehydratase [Vibrio hannami]
MAKRKPTVISQHCENTKAILELKVDRDILDFTGHFPSFALLPGVTQIDWVMYFAKQVLGVHQEFAGMEVIKFQQPILPDSLVSLELNWDKEHSKLQFKYFNQELVHASGKIKLGDSQ